MSRRARDKIPWLARLLVSLALTTWLLSKIDLNELAQQWLNADWVVVLWGIPLVQLACIVLRSTRQQLILRSFALHIPLSWLCFVQTKALFFRTFLPGGLGGDIYNAYSVAKRTDLSMQSITAVLLERYFGIASMLLLSVAALLYGRAWLDPSVLNAVSSPIFAATGLFLLASLTVTVAARRQFLRSRLVRAASVWRPVKLWNDITDQIAAFLKRAKLLQILTVSLLIQVFVVLWYFTISTALALDVALHTFMIVIPIVELLITLPVSIGGMGVREGALVMLLAPFGISAESAVSLALASFTTTTVLNLLSGTSLLFHESEARLTSGRESPRREMLD